MVATHQVALAKEFGKRIIYLHRGCLEKDSNE
jgi:hypothetical protein